MNFLHVIHRYYPYVGGSEGAMQELSERLVRDGHAVSVYTTDAWDLEHFWANGKRRVETPSETHNGVRIYRLPVERLPASPLAYPAVRRLVALADRLPFDAKPLQYALARNTPRVPQLDRALDIFEGPCDLIHVANISLDSMVYAAYRLARRRAIPLVITPYLHLGEPGDAQVRRFYTMSHQIEMLSRADAVIVQTELESAALVELGVPRARIHCIGLGVNPGELLGGKGERFREKYNIRTPIVFTVGVGSYDKGTVHLVEAMEKIWQENDGVDAPVLVIAGPLMSDFERFLATRSPETRRRTLMVGLVQGDDKRDLFAAGDVFVLPSRTESFGIVYLEAWLYNKPVIGARAGGVPAVITDGRDGFLVRFGDTREMADRIKQLLKDQELAAQFGQAGHDRVLRELTWDIKYSQMRALYEQVARARTSYGKESRNGTDSSNG